MKKHKKHLKEPKAQKCNQVKAYQITKRYKKAQKSTTKHKKALKVQNST